MVVGTAAIDNGQGVGTLSVLHDPRIAGAENDEVKPQARQYTENVINLADGMCREKLRCILGMVGLPAQKLGRLWKFKLSEVDDWVRAGGGDDVISPSNGATGT